MGLTKASEVEAASESDVVVASCLSVVRDDASESERTLKRKSPEIGSSLVDVCDRTERKKRAVQKDSKDCHQGFDAPQIPSTEMENKHVCSKNSLNVMPDAAADYIPLCDDDAAKSSSGSDDAHNIASTFSGLTTSGDSIRPHFCSGSWRCSNNFDYLMELIDDTVDCSRIYPMEDDYVALSDLGTAGHLDPENGEKELDRADYIPLPDDSQSSYAATFGDNAGSHYPCGSWRCSNDFDDLTELMIDGNAVCSRIYPMDNSYVALSELPVAGHQDTENGESEQDNADYIPLPDDTQSSDTYTTLPYDDNLERIFDLIERPDDTLSTWSSVASCEPCSRTSADSQDSLWKLLEADDDCSDAESCCGNQRLQVCRGREGKGDDILIHLYQLVEPL